MSRSPPVTQAPALEQISNELVYRIAAKMGPEWWDLTKETTLDDNDEFASVHEAQISQITFYKVKMYLHLPYMLKTATNPRYEFSRNACIDAAKRGLQTYHSLQNNFFRFMRTFFDCQVMDFIGFTCATVFLLGLLGYGRPQITFRNYRDPEDEADWQLIYKTIDIFRNYAPHRSSAVTQQSYQCLEFLSKTRDCDGKCDGKEDPVVNIPYFGTLKIGKSKFAEIAKLRSTHISIAPTPDSQCGGTVQQMPTPPDPQPLEQSIAQNSNSDPLISYNGFYMPDLDNFNFDLSQGDGRFGGAAVDPNANWWQTNGNMDIDQDWGWFAKNM